MDDLITPTSLSLFRGASDSDAIYRCSERLYTTAGSSVARSKRPCFIIYRFQSDSGLMVVGNLSFCASVGPAVPVGAPGGCGGLVVPGGKEEEVGEGGEGGLSRGLAVCHPLQVARRLAVHL